MKYKISNKLKPFLVEGGTHVDDRGVINYINDMSFFKFKRMYVIENFQENFIRAWHGHKKENKVFFCISGTFKVAAVKIDSFSSPSKNLTPKEFILSSTSPKFLYIPKGYANGLTNLSSNAKLIVFSDKLLEESLNDDYRFDYNFWDIWKIKYK